jgi:hypothetical protein
MSPYNNTDIDFGAEPCVKSAIFMLEKGSMRKRIAFFTITLLFEAVFAALGYGVAALLGRSAGGGMLDLGLGILGMLIGIAVGNGLSAWWLARREGAKGKAWRFWLTAIALLAAVLLLAEPLHLNTNTTLMLTTLFGIPALGQALLA